MKKTNITKEKAINSEISQMTPELEKLIARVEEDIKHNRNMVGPFHNAEEMNKYLDSL